MAAAPLVTLVLPVYNEQANITACLESIYEQDYPHTSIEVLLVDDDSTDQTVLLASRYPVRTVRNGQRDYDAGKAIGIREAKGEYIIMIDADNRIKDPAWIRKAVQMMQQHSEVALVQSWKFAYDRRHTPATRYADLFGNTDPLVYYLNRQDHLAWHKMSWDLAGQVYLENSDCVLVRFTPDEVPTLGSQVSMMRPPSNLKEQDVFQHVEYFINLAEQQDGLKAAFMKNDVEHLSFSTVGQLLYKLGRNMEHYLDDIKNGAQQRYAIRLGRLMCAVLTMQTLVVPLYHAAVGFCKKRDPAWFLHPLLCLVVPWLYMAKTLGHKIRLFRQRNPAA